MEAIVLRGTGPPSVLELTQHPEPKATPGTVVVELRAASVNRRDLLVRAGTYVFDLPLVPGADGAGVRRDTGEEVVILPNIGWGDSEEAPATGFEILGGPRDGTYAELIAVPEANLFPKPQRLSWQQAAALPVGGLTAYRALFGRGRLQAGETVAVLGAGGGVATFLVLLAVQAGADVLVTSSSDEKIARAVDLGARAGANYRSEDWAAHLLELSHGRGIDLMVDSAGSTWSEALRCLRPGGRLVTFGATETASATFDVRRFYAGQHSLIGSTQGSPRDFVALLHTLEEGAWTPVVDSIHPLAGAADAHARLETGTQFGKLVLDVSS
jgi:NADPH:quinone reductase-like Zn-dependent oxidoreductase